jgi:hypothetical protein
MAPGLDISTLDTPAPTLALSPISIKQSSVTITSTAITPEPQIPTNITLVLDPSLITTEFDDLRFHAAAFDQLPKADSKHVKDKPTYSTLLISSPYNAPGHYLDLTPLPLPSLLFAKALTSLAPTSDAYATTPYTSALNFSHVLAVLRSLVPPGYVYPATSFYVVVFQSKLKDGIDMDWLYKLDYESHGEACESGGLLKYWFGRADSERRNLATCKLTV